MRHTTIALAVFLLGCVQPPQVGEPTYERYKACTMGYECAVECEAPEEALRDLGCSPGDFYSTPPNCMMEDNCNQAKSECYSVCEEQYDSQEEQLDCKIECSEDFGNDSACKDNFQQWLVKREQVLQSYLVCLSPCEGRPSRKHCAEGHEGCDAVVHARHDAVTKVEECYLGSEDSCNWSCEDPIWGYPQEGDQI